MKALIIDDNIIARTTLKHLASKIQDLEVAGECANAMEAYNELNKQTIDLLLLDIEMPEISGVELTKNLVNKRPLIIFITSKKDYAVEAFELNVVDYLVKPITPARFIQAIDKARELFESSHEEVKINNEEFIFIRDSNIIRRLKVDDILIVEAMGDFVKLHTISRFFAIHSTLKSVEERLPTEKFIRVHRSYIIAINKIDTIQDGVLILNGKPVPVADTYRALLNKKMNII
ncbi:MAG: LytTR family DNA-binding domain-containing protein [Ginsengibacter sp.]